MEYIKSIALFLIFVSFLEKVFEFGHMKKYMKLFCGIVLIFILLQPIKNIFNKDFDINKILETKELELKMAEMGEGLNGDETILDVVEENVREIVWDEGYELAYIHVSFSDENTGDINGINISIKEKNEDISVQKISLSHENRETNVETIKISEKIAEYYDLAQSDVIIYVE